MVDFNPEYDREIRRLVDDNPKNYLSMIKSRGFRGRYEDRSYLLDYINEVTPQLSSDQYTLKTKIYWVLNHFVDFPQCKSCGKRMDGVNVKSITAGYKSFCSPECMYSSSQWLSAVERGVENNYGVRNYFMTNEFHNKQTELKDEIQKKRNASKKVHGTFNVSGKEHEAYNILVSVYGRDDVYTQYSDSRYPFNCDFYIKSIDQFIEFNGMWTHNDHQFDSNDSDDDKTLTKWKEMAKTSAFYKNAIETWTVRDVNKRRTAEDNGLNYLTFWNLDEMRQHYGSGSGVSLVIPWDRKLARKEYEYYRDHAASEVYSVSQRNYIVKFFQQDMFYRKERELWNNENVRAKLVANREKYLGKKVSDMTVMEILSGFKKSGLWYGYSHFNPLWFKYFITKYGVKTCYDPCGGWGHRLLGALNLEKYIYNDLSKTTVSNVNRIISHFNIRNTVTYNMDCRTFIPKEEFGAMFTCPPYFNLECYECGVFKDRKEFNDMIDSLFYVFKSSESCSIFGLVIREDMLGQHSDYIERIPLVVRASHMTKHKDNSECMFIFRK